MWHLIFCVLQRDLRSAAEIMENYAPEFAAKLLAFAFASLQE
jgi:hypothetical protein